jgi:hypothetical protein
VSRRGGPQVVTANDLVSGAVVFWTGEGWSRDPDDARVLHEPEAQRAALAAAEADGLRVIGAYLAAVGDDGLVRLRERIRTTGPTIAYAGPVRQQGG